MSTTTCPPIKTAFVVVDMQNYFMAPGQQVEIPAAREIVPNINRLADALRKAGGLVVWVRTDLKRGFVQELVALSRHSQHAATQGAPPRGYEGRRVRR